MMHPVKARQRHARRMLRVGVPRVSVERYLGLSRLVDVIRRRESYSTFDEALKGFYEGVVRTVLTRTTPLFRYLRARR